MTNDNDARGALTEIRAAFDERHIGYVFPSDALESGAFNEFCAGWHASRKASQLPAGDGLTDEVWPVVNVTVGEDGQISAAKLYAPGLPPGNHDVYPVRVPYMDEHTEAWMAVAKALEEVAPGYHDGSGNGIECAVAAIHRLAAPRQPGEMGAGVQQEIQLLEQIAACGDTWNKQALQKRLDDLRKNPNASAQQDEREALSDDAILDISSRFIPNADKRARDSQIIDFARAVLHASAAQQVQADAGAVAIQQWRYFGNAAWLDAAADEIEKRKASNLAEDMEFRTVYTHPSPAAESDKRDAERWRNLRRKVCIVDGKFHILNLWPTYVAPDAAAELDAVTDAAMLRDEHPEVAENMDRAADILAAPAATRASDDESHLPPSMRAENIAGTVQYERKHAATRAQGAVTDERAAIQYVVDCWEAAEAEGLADALLDAKNVRSETAQRLADLIERRISFGIERARAILAAPAQGTKCTRCEYIGKCDCMPAQGSDARDLIEYVLQDGIQNRLTPRVVDIAYTAFMSGAVGKTKGGPNDWMNDTRPRILAAIEKLRSDIRSAMSREQPTEQPKGGE